MIRRYLLIPLALLMLIAETSVVMAESPLQKATFAGGCFWCMEPAYDALAGVHKTVVGYMGGSKKDPTYHEVSAGTTGHAEVVQVSYDSSKIGYEALINIFWKNIDPTTPNRQFCDVGTQYRTAVFYHSEEQREIAERTFAAMQEILDSQKIATEIVAASTFYPAEEYHQEYYKKNPARYAAYKYQCGREQRLKALWGESKD